MIRGKGGNPKTDSKITKDKPVDHLNSSKLKAKKTQHFTFYTVMLDPRIEVNARNCEYGGAVYFVQFFSFGENFCHMQIKRTLHNPQLCLLKSSKS